MKAEYASSSSTISNLEATIREKEQHIEILQSQRQRSGAETEEEFSRVKRAHEKLEAQAAALREQVTDREVTLFCTIECFPIVCRNAQSKQSNSYSCHF